MARRAPLPAAFPLRTPIMYCDLCRELQDAEDTIQWCQTMRLLASSKNCSCGHGMHLVKRKGVGAEEKGWRCPRKGCRREARLRQGTFFEGELSFLLYPSRSPNCSNLLTYTTVHTAEPKLN